jgi:hypothetical protein
VREEEQQVNEKTRRRLGAVAAVSVFGVAVFVAVATAVQAVKQDSWGPVLAIGWLPAVLVASFARPTAWKRCRPLRRPGLRS